MKKYQLIIAAAAVCTALVSCSINVDGENFGGKTVKGNGNIVTRNYDVTDFNEISASLSATINFTIADNYSCIVTTDENLFEYIEIKVDDKDLHLRKLDEHKNVGLRATKMVIDVTAPSLENINLAGSGTFNALSPLNAEKMEVNLAGSGDVVLKQTVTAQYIELNVAGSGDLFCQEVIADRLEANVAGSGDIKVSNGTVKNAEASVAGSGDIDLSCEIDILSADVAGSGDIVAKVNDTLEYSVIGSGDITYYGNAVVKGDKMGLGSVHHKEASKD